MNKKRLPWIILTAAFTLWPAVSHARLTWDAYLDVAYKVTWWDDQEIADWVNRTEKQLGQPLATYVSTWQSNVTGTAESAQTVRTDNQTKNSYPFQSYKRLAIAELLLYLRSHEQEHLNEASRIIDRVGDDQEKADVAFWKYYIHAHQHISTDNHKTKNVKFINSVYKLWNDVILKLEKAQIQSSIPEMEAGGGNLYNDLPYLYENIVDLIVERAIVKNQMKDLEALGSIIWAVEPRLVLKDGYAQQVKLINKRVHGPKSDVFRLTFTVGYLEAEKYRFKAQHLLDKEGPTPKAEETFTQALKYYELAYQYARTRQGQISAVSDHLDLVSFALARIPGRQSLSPDQQFLTIVGHEGANIGTLAVRLFDDLAKQEIAYKKDTSGQKNGSGKAAKKGYWSKHGFSDRQTYIYAMHTLWRSVTELYLWTANYYLKEIKSTDIKDFYADAPPGQAALVQYLDFFETHARESYLEVVPDNAYFNASEAASTLFDIYYHLAPYSSDSNMYDLAFGRLLESIEICPFNLKNVDKLAQFLMNEGMLDRYGKVLPLSRHIRSSLALRTWVNEGKKNDIEKLIKATPAVVNSAPAIHFFQREGSAKIKDNLQSEIKDINEAIEGYQLKHRIRVHFQNNLETLERHLGDAATRLDAKEIAVNHPGVWEVVERIKKLQLRIRNYKAVSALMVSYPSTVKLSADLKETLLRNIEHPMHTLLRKFYQERNPEKLNYLDIIKPRKVAKEEDTQKEETKASRGKTRPKSEKKDAGEALEPDVEEFLDNLIVG